MQNLTRRSNGHRLSLNGSPFGTGGQGAVYEVKGEPQTLAKIYKTPTQQFAEKLKFMVAHPPALVKDQGHQTVAWPFDLLQDPSGQTVGFLMPKASGMRSLIDVYTPATRHKVCPHFNYLYLHRTARNLALAFHSLHSAGYVVGDVKEANVLVSTSALVTVVDADSFQVCSPNAVFYCPVVTPEYTPPEFLSKDPLHNKRLPSHDLFGLSVLIYMLIMEGVHPFAGVFQGRGEPPDTMTRIASGDFAYAPRSRVRPSPLSLPLRVLPPPIQRLFMRCFCDGHSNPSLRPSAREWSEVLLAAERDLQ